jgi:hypothetical protein
MKKTIQIILFIVGLILILNFLEDVNQDIYLRK